MKRAFLILILILAAAVNFYPHINYKYPIHVDEWGSIAYAQAVEKEGVYIKEPYIGEEEVKDTEIGFHYFLLGLQKFTGLDWMELFRFFPTIFFVILVFLAYLFGAKSGYGLEAAFFTALIPTSLRLLGPRFLVPVSLGAVFFLLSLYVVCNFRNTLSYLSLFLIGLFLIVVHIPTALILFMVLFIYILLNLKKENKHCRNIFLAMCLAGAFSVPMVMELIIPVANTALVTGSHYLPRLQEVFKLYGILPTAFFVLGAFFMCYKKKKHFLIISSAALLLFIFLFVHFNFGPYIMYDRSYIFLFILMSLIAGFALSRLRLFESKFTKALYVLAIAAILPISLYASVNEPYYHIIYDHHYDDFVWIGENLDGVGVMDIWKAKAFTPITGKRVYSHLPQGPHDEIGRRNKEIGQFFDGNCTNTTFLRKNNISIIYGECENRDLIKVRDRTYISESKDLNKIK